MQNVQILYLVNVLTVVNVLYKRFKDFFFSNFFASFLGDEAEEPDSASASAAAAAAAFCAAFLGFRL